MKSNHFKISLFFILLFSEPTYNKASQGMICTGRTQEACSDDDEQRLHKSQRAQNKFGKF